MSRSHKPVDQAHHGDKNQAPDQRDELVAAALGKRLAEQTDDVPAHVAGRLAAARRAALDTTERQSSTSRMSRMRPLLASAAGIATLALALWVGMPSWQAPPDNPQARSAPAATSATQDSGTGEIAVRRIMPEPDELGPGAPLELLTDGGELELMEDIDFYFWLTQMSDAS